MANTPITMNKLRSILRLRSEGRGSKHISKRVGVSRNTVKRYIEQLKALGQPIEEVLAMDNHILFELFQARSEPELSPKLKQLYEFFPRVQQELRRTGVTRRLMWEEYISTYPDGYGKSQFCHYYRQWSKRTNPSMHMEHKAGDKVFYDFAGQRLSVVDEETGEISYKEVFVSILGASQLIYVEAVDSQKIEDFVGASVNSANYYGGMAQAIVPDNLKSAVIKADRYEPKLNEVFEDFADHYGATVLPARVRKPKDKALVEGAVKIVYTRIYAPLRDQVFHSLEALNKAIGVELEKLNNSRLQNRPYSRRELFDQTEAHELIPLPVMPFEFKHTAWATVMKCGFVHLRGDKHYYSVPHKLIGKKVKVVWSRREVSIFYHHQRVALHRRSLTKYSYTTEAQHLASTHRFVTEWNPDYFRRWASNIDPNVEQLIVDILERKKHPELAYRSCLGVLGLAKKVGKDRLANACKRALEYGACNYKMVQNILDKGLDKVKKEDAQQTALPLHDNIRGREYYA